ncbi:MAG: hypothetical protein MK132_14695 [Lentisphaerales bacterium]|nr:hypothetical protein [Lentisphaerales bacterium]
MFKKCLLFSLLFCSTVLAQSPQLKVIIAEFKSNGTAQEAFKKLEELSKKNDPKNLGIRIIFNPKKVKKLNLDFSNMPVAEIVRYLCLSAGYKYKVTNRTVNIIIP